MNPSSECTIPKISRTRSLKANTFALGKQINPFGRFLLETQNEFNLKTVNSNTCTRIPLWKKKSEPKNLEILREFRQEKQDLWIQAKNEQGAKLNMKDAINSAIKHLPNKKTSPFDFINQKREMFLVQMKITEKKEKMRFFEMTTLERNDELLKFETKVQKDYDKFSEFLENDKILTVEQMKETENLTKEKCMVLAKLSDLAEKKTPKMNDIAKLLEKLSTLISYKKFLDSVAPIGFPENIKDENGVSEWTERYLKKPNPVTISMSKISQPKFSQTQAGNFLALKMTNKGSSGSLSRESLSRQKSNSTRFKPVNLRNSLNVEKLVKVVSHVKLVSSFSIVSVDQNLVEFISKTHEKTSPDLIGYLTNNESPMQMHFHNPSDLVNIANKIEEKNLKLIKKTQKLKAKNEDKEIEFEKLKKVFWEEKVNLLRTKTILEKSIANEKHVTFPAKTDGWNCSEEVTKILELITGKLLLLADLLGVKKGIEVNKVLLEIEVRIQRDLLKLNTLEKKVLRKLEKNVLDQKKKTSVEENLAFLRKLGCKKEEKLKNKMLRAFLNRTVIFRSFIRPTDFGLEKNLELDNAEYENATYFS